VRPTRTKLSQAAIEGKPVEEDVDDDEEGVQVEDKEENETFQPSGKEKSSAKTKNSAKEGKKTTKKAPDRANYRKLKIKNKNSKAKGRFGRRR
jgi:hypothetical protein